MCPDNLAIVLIVHSVFIANFCLITTLNLDCRIIIDMPSDNKKEETKNNNDTGIIEERCEISRHLYNNDLVLITVKSIVRKQNKPLNRLIAAIPTKVKKRLKSLITTIQKRLKKQLKRLIA